MDAFPLRIRADERNKLHDILRPERRGVEGRNQGFWRRLSHQAQAVDLHSQRQLHLVVWVRSDPGQRRLVDKRALPISNVLCGSELLELPNQQVRNARRKCRHDYPLLPSHPIHFQLLLVQRHQLRHVLFLSPSVSQEPAQREADRADARRAP